MDRHHLVYFETFYGKVEADVIFEDVILFLHNNVPAYITINEDDFINLISTTSCSAQD